jgi:hypothetical protein
VEVWVTILLEPYTCRMDVQLYDCIETWRERPTTTFSRHVDVCVCVCVCVASFFLLRRQ